MKNLIIIILAVFTISSAHAVDIVGQRYIEQLTQGGNVSIKRTAQSIFNTGEKNPEVLDVLAEVLLQRYPSAGTQDLDTLAWVAKALGRSENPRYHSALKEVVDSDSHRKLRKYAKKAMKQVGKPNSDQYLKGAVNLKDIAAKGKSVAKAASAAPVAATGTAGLDVIRKGMSLAEVHSLVGMPTATTTHQTGKAWNPFNVAKQDLARSIILYKGKGRIVLSHDGYSSTARVVEVNLDPNESGYP